jgi:hypothetical protein
MLTNGYGTVYFNKDIVATTNATFQIIGNEQRWDLDTIHVKIETLDSNGVLIVGYGPNANNPEICRFASIADTDVRIRNAGVDNPNQLPLNAVWTGVNLEASINAGAHIVKQGGENFIELNSAPAFGARSGYGLENIGSTLFVFGGLTSSGAVADSWSSTDGITWTQLTPLAIFNARYNFSTCSFVSGGVQGIVISGGTDGNNYFDDVWFTADGITWTLLSNGDFPVRAGHQMKYLNGKLFVVGGSNSVTIFNDVWSSPDGVVWTLVTASAPFAVRRLFQMQVFNGKLYVMGGLASINAIDTIVNDVWSSPDGLNWQQPYSPNLFTARFGFSSDVGFSGLGRIPKIRIFGGYDGTNYYNDGYESIDGGNWLPINIINSFSTPRYLHSSKKM